MSNQLHNQQVKHYEDSLKFLKAEDAQIQNAGTMIERFLGRVFKTKGRNVRYSKRGPFGIVLSAMFDIKNLMFLNLSQAINENNARVAQHPESIRALASGNSYEALRPIPASGTVEVTINRSIIAEQGVGVIVIEQNAVLQSLESNLQFYVDIEESAIQIDLSVNNKASINVYQGFRKSQSFVLEGDSAEVIELIDAEGTISELPLSVRVNGELWSTDKKLLRNLLPNEKGVIIRNAQSGGIRLFFGNGNNGKIPQVGAQLLVEYVLTNGAEGNLAANKHLRFISGVTDRQGNELQTETFITAKTSTNFISGYDGDDIDTMRLNIGQTSMHNVLATAPQIKSYMRRYPQYVVGRVWSTPGPTDIQVLMLPNLRELARTSYFDLDITAFVVTDDERLRLKSAIDSDNKIAVITTVDFTSYNIVTYAILVFLKFDRPVSDVKKFESQFQSALSEALIEEYEEDTMQISRTALGKKITNALPNIESIQLQFISNSDGAQYIDELGDIDVRNNDPASILIPVIRAGTYNSYTVDRAFKLLVETGVGNWSELVEG